MHSLELRTLAYRPTLTGLESQRDSTRAEWEEFGGNLRALEESKQWLIGDWLVDGKRHYGDGLYQRASEILGIAEKTLSNIKNIAESIALPLRRGNLSWSHHQTVAYVKSIDELSDGHLCLSSETDHEAIGQFLERAETESLSVRTLRKQVTDCKHAQEQQIIAANAPPVIECPTSTDGETTTTEELADAPEPEGEGEEASENNPKRLPPLRFNEAMMHAGNAIDSLEKIQPQDESREKALDLITQWVETHR